MLGGISKNKRGISPVVATVILVAVTIVVAVAVSYWMGGITGLYTRFEKVEMTSMYSTYGDTIFGGTDPGWNITINLRNTGSIDATIDNLLINGRPYDDATYTGRISDVSLPQPLPVGEDVTIWFLMKKGDSFQPGVNIDVKLHSASGQEYPKTLLLV